MSRTKIVATYGPACEDERVFAGMLRAGLDVVRLNVSHLEPALLPATAKRLRRIAAAADRPLTILADMPGPKIRCTVCEPEAFELRAGDRLRLAPGKDASTPERLVVQYPRLLDDVKKGHEIAINDGLVLVRVEHVSKRSGVLECRVLRGGPVSSRKGVSFLHSTLRVPGLTPRDRLGIRAAAGANVDFIALSFVRSASDVQAARRVLARAKRPDVPLIAKIEQHEAIDRIDEILRVSEGVMVARGDMGIELPLETVPLLQKDIIARSNHTGRFVITATHMLESMVENARPTRAEVTDVANAILDGTDAVMLSAETAVGRHPACVVRTMTRIADAAETRIDPREWLRRLAPLEGPPAPSQVRRRAAPGPDLDDAVARAACQLAVDARLDAIVCLSFHGTTARRVARYRPACPLYVLTPHEEQCRRLALTWGVEAWPFPEARRAAARRTQSPGALIGPMLDALRSRGGLKRGQRVAMLAGSPLGAPGATNYLRMIEV